MAKGSSLSVCMTPSMLGLYNLQDKSVVVVDVFRASSTITSALAHGVKQVVAVDTWERCSALRDLGFVTAGERGGKQLDGCDIDNSPMVFERGDWTHKKIALTTTNGTQAIVAARAAKTLYIGCFLNLSAVVKRAQSADENWLILCAGRNGKMSPEDTLCAGALADALRTQYTLSDEAHWAAAIYQYVKKDIKTFLAPFTHTKRLQEMGKTHEMTFCLKQDRYAILPCYRNGYIEKDS